jgi:uncharacterized protein (DUF169 family)
MTAGINWRELDERISNLLGLSVRPVAVTFLDAEPAGVKKYEGTQPLWMQFLAARGGGKELLYRSRKPLQLRRGRLHTQHRA